MARTALTVQEIGYQGGIADITWEAANVDGNSFVNDGKTFFLVKNGDVSPKTSTLVSVADPWGRTGDLALVTSAGEEGIAGPLARAVWNQSAGEVNVDYSAITSVEVAAVRFIVIP